MLVALKVPYTLYISIYVRGEDVDTQFGDGSYWTVPNRCPTRACTISDSLSLKVHSLYISAQDA